MTTTTSTPPPPMFLGPNGQKLIRRSSSGIWGGVAGGIAHYFGVDPKWTRFAFLVSLFLGGFGFFLYIAAWLALPTDQDPRTGTVVFTDNVIRLAAGAVFGLFALGAVSGTATVSAALLLPGLLVGGGIYLLMQDSASRQSFGGQNPKDDGSVGSGWGATMPPAPAPTPPGREAPVDDRDPLLIEADRLMSGDAFTTSTADDPAHWALTQSEQDVLSATAPRRRSITKAVLGLATLVSVLLVVTEQGGIVAAAAVFTVLAAGGFLLSLLRRRPAWALLGVVLGGALIIPAVTVARPSYEFLDGEFGFGQVRVAPEPPPIPNIDDLDSSMVAIDLRAIELTAAQSLSFDPSIGPLDFDLPQGHPVRFEVAENSRLIPGASASTDYVDARSGFTVNADEPGPLLTIDLTAAPAVVRVDQTLSSVTFD